MLGEAGLDLAELDAEAADLDLLVVAAEEVDIAVGPIASKIAGLVQAIAGDERAVEEALGGELGTVEIPARHPRPADVDLTHCAERHRLAVRVQQINPRVRDRAADRDDELGGVVSAQRAGRSASNGRLGGAVEIDQLRRASRENRVAEPMRRQRFAADDHEASADGHESLPSVRFELRQLRRGMQVE